MTTEAERDAEVARMRALLVRVAAEHRTLRHTASELFADVVQFLDETEGTASSKRVPLEDVPVGTRVRIWRRDGGTIEPDGRVGVITHQGHGVPERSSQSTHVEAEGARGVGLVFGHWLAEVIDEPVVAADEQFDLRLWAHVVGVHCNAVWPHQVTNADLIDYHCHEHEGPGTIRDHAETDRRVDLAKIYEVLGEEGAREVARLASDVAAKQRGYDDLHAMVPEPRGADIWTKVDALKRTTATLAAACDAAEERARDLAAKCERLRDEVASLREEAAIVCGMIACDRAAEIYSLYPDEDHPAGRLAWAAFDAAHGSRWSHLRWAEAEALLHCGWPQITEAERTTSGATDAIVDLQALHKPVPR